MKKLGIQTGDVIALEGNKLTAAIAWTSYPQDKGLGICRIDSRIQKNTGSNFDELIKIRKINSMPARKVVIQPDITKLKSNPRFETFIRRKLHKLPVTMDDLIDVSIGISKEITFRVIELKPPGVCIITPETELTISGSEDIEAEEIDSYPV